MNQQYSEQQIFAVLNNPNDFPPKKVAEMIENKCFSIKELKDLSAAQKQKINAALLKGKEDEYYQKCLGEEATINDCQFFIDNFNTSAHLDEIKNRWASLQLKEERKKEKRRIEQAEFIELSNKVQDSSVGYDEKKNLVARFRDSYPFSEFECQLNALSNLIEEEERNRVRYSEDEMAWQGVLGKLASGITIAEKRNALNEYEISYSLHRSEIPARRQELTDQEDEIEWQKVLSAMAQDIPADRKMYALDHYKSQYLRHLNEVPAKIKEIENERNIMPEINGVLGNSASSVLDFLRLIKKYPSKKEYVRQYMLKDMRVNPSRYSREYMYWLMNGKYDGNDTYEALFSIGELQDARIASYDILNHINTHPTDNDDRDQLEDSLLPEENFKSAPNNTDIYFFGVPGSGKSTVLAGLFKLGTSGNLRLSLPAHGDHIGYTYASILQNYLERNVFPQATKTRFVLRQDLSPVDSTLVGDETLPNPFDSEKPVSISMPESVPDSSIGTEVSDKFIQIIDGVLQENPGTENQEDHKISIIEMPGERTLDFAASNVKDPEEMDRLLGTGTKGLFMNDNRKLFFFVIDPKPQRTYNVSLNGVTTPMTQAQALMALVEFIDKVPGLLEKIDSIHIVLSKSDLLSDSDSFDIISKDVIEKGYDGLVSDIKNLCNPARSNINVQCGHSPYIFTFSLGTVYPGHMIKYKKDDAEKILRVIAANTYSTRRNPTKLTSFIDWMNK